MSLDSKTFTVGVSGLLATVTIEQVNSGLACAVGILTVLGIIPLVITRWRRFLAKQPRIRKDGSIAPFRE